MKIKWLLVAIACMTCLEWTRLSGVVKGVNLKDSTVTIQNRDGDLLTVPVDYQVSMVEKHGEKRTLKTLGLDEKVWLIRIPTDPPKEKDVFEGLAPAEPAQHGL